MCFLFRIILLCSCITIFSIGCTGGEGNKDGTLSTSDSIMYLLQKGTSLPDSMRKVSIECLERAKQLSMQKNPGKSALFDIYYNLALQTEKTGNYELASSYFDKAVEYSSKKNITDKGTALNHIALMALEQGKYDIALDYFYKALNIRIHLNDIEGQASSYKNIGTAYQGVGDYKQALEQYEQSQKLYKELNNELGIAGCLNNIGGLFLEQGNHESALQYYFESEQIYNRTNNRKELWNIYHNIGEVYHSIGDALQAKVYFSKMLAESKSLSSPKILAETYIALGIFYDENQQNDKAIYYFELAKEKADSSKLYGILQQSMDELSRLYAMSGRFEDAYKASVAYNSAYDIVNNKENIKAFTEKSEKNKFDMQQQDLLYRNRIQKIYMIALGFVAFLIAAMGIQFYRACVRRKKFSELLVKQNELLEEQKEKITSAIRYAQLIQNATLPSKEYMDEILPEYFLYYKPRDIVSGDFYWVDSLNNFIIVVVADCTGHGVPGAIVSMLGITSLVKIVDKMTIPKADSILNELRKEIIQILNPKGSDAKRQDGMDISLVVIDLKNHKMEFAGAYNPLYLVRKHNDKLRYNELIEKKANRMPIGLYVKQDVPFTSETFDLMPGDTIYMFSDGYADQFGGKESKKFKTNNLKRLLLDVSEYSMEEQKQLIDKAHLEWKGTHDQIDDISLMGIRIENYINTNFE